MSWLVVHQDFACKRICFVAPVPAQLHSVSPTAPTHTGTSAARCYIYLESYHTLLLQHIRRQLQSQRTNPDALYVVSRAEQMKVSERRRDFKVSGSGLCAASAPV